MPERQRVPASFQPLGLLIALLRGVTGRITAIGTGVGRSLLGNTIGSGRIAALLIALLGRILLLRILLLRVSGLRLLISLSIAATRTIGRGQRAGSCSQQTTGKSTDGRSTASSSQRSNRSTGASANQSAVPRPLSGAVRVTTSG